MNTLLRRRAMIAGGVSPIPPGPEPPTPTGENIVFADPVVAQICATKWGDGTNITDIQAAAVTNAQFGTTFANNANIVSFDELGTYFTGLTSIAGGTSGNRAFEGCTALKSITIPATVTSIGNYAFWGCSALETFVLPATVTTRGQQMFQGCTGLKSLTIYGNISTVNLTSANGTIGDGTGTLIVNGNLDQGAATIVLAFNEIHITGNAVKTASGSNVLITSPYTEKVIVDGNVDRNYTLCSSSGIKFLEIGGTYNFYVLGSSTPTDCIAHLKYNDVAGTATNMRIARVSKVYVDTQEVLDKYLVSPDWTGQSSKLDLWENYNGIYK